jgi:hypothetical protein
MLKYKSKFKKYLLLLEETIEDPRFPVNDNIASLSFLYLQQQIKLSHSEGSLTKANT